MKDNVERARELFAQKYNCSQSVAASFAEKLNIDEDILLKAAAAFGGGMFMGETCGAATGACMVLGFVYGTTDPTDADQKAIVKNKTQEFMQKFQAEHGSLKCKTLLGNDETPGTAKVPCSELVTFAVETLNEIIGDDI